MIVGAADSGTTDFNAMERLADLKIQEAELLREVTGIEMTLAAKSAELARLRCQIDLLSQRRKANTGSPEKGHTRPQRRAGAVARDADGVSLLVLIESLLRQAVAGLSLADLVQKVTEGRRAGRSNTPRAMVDQAIFRLKARGLIGRNPDNLKFYFIR